jgi:hypothetical protein
MRRPPENSIMRREIFSFAQAATRERTGRREFLSMKVWQHVTEALFDD